MEKSLADQRLQHIRAVLFDFDGTLAPNLDLPDMRRQVIELTEATGIPAKIYADRYIVEVIDTATDWLATQDPQAAERYNTSAHDLITEIEMTAAATTKPFPGVPDFLRRLGDAGIGTAVVTRNCRAAVLQTFPNLNECVDAIFARDDVVYLKPDSRHLTDALTYLNQPAQAAAMIGDGRLDMHAGKNLGMACIGVLGGSSDADALLDAGADLIVEKCVDINFIS